MAIINNCAIYFAKLDPKRPSTKFSADNPSWELQIRTDDPAQKEEWVSKDLKPRLMTFPEGHDNEGEPILTDDGKKQWKLSLRKKSIKKDGNPASPIDVLDGNLDAVDPNSIGNGSIGNIRIYQYEYLKDQKNPSAGVGIASIPMKVQLVKHIVYIPKPRDDDFTMQDTVVIPADVEGEEGAAPTAEASLTPTPTDTPTPTPAGTPTPTTTAPANAADPLPADSF